MKRVAIFAGAVCCCLGAASSAPADEAFRLAVGGGYGVGSNSGAYQVDRGTLDLQSVTGGSGPVVTAQLWVDHVALSDLSMRVEFLRLINEATATLDLPHGIGILTDPSGGRAKLSATANLGFVDVAFRPQMLDPALSFYIGAGAGGGTGRAAGSFSLENPVLGGVAERASAQAPIGGVHGFIGAEFHLTKSFFVSVEPEVLYVSGHPVGIHQSYVDMMVATTLGYSF